MFNSTPIGRPYKKPFSITVINQWFNYKIQITPAQNKAYKIRHLANLLSAFFVFEWAVLAQKCWSETSPAPGFSFLMQNLTPLQPAGSRRGCSGHHAVA